MRNCVSLFVICHFVFTNPLSHISVPPWLGQEVLFISHPNQSICYCKDKEYPCERRIESEESCCYNCVLHLFYNNLH